MRILAIASIMLALSTAIPAEAAGPAEQSRGASPARTHNALPGDDIEAMAFIVLMEAAKSAQEDLKAIMAQVKAINDAKKKQREEMGAVDKTTANNATGAPCHGAAKLRDCIHETRVKMVKMELATLDLMRASVLATQSHATLLGDSLRRAPEETERMRKKLPPPARIIPTNPCRGWNVSFWKQCVVLMKAELAGYLPDPKTQAEIDAQLDAMGQHLDSMSEMSELNSMRLQMMMDRRSKLVEALSNALKKISRTANSITQNLK